MSADIFTRDDVVLLHQGDHDYVGIVGDQRGAYWLVDFGGDGPGAWLVAESMTKLPAGTPVLHKGDVAHIAADATAHPGQCGMVERPGFEPVGEPADDTFGYWLALHATGEQVWVPGTVLTTG